jgi:hypothetical protein
MEIKNQCEFALQSIASINKLMSPPVATLDSNQVWFYIQSFLTSTANVSKLLFGTKDPRFLLQENLCEIPLMYQMTSAIKIT